MEAQYIETLIYSYIILICLIGLWMLLGLIGRLILTRRAEKANGKSSLWYLAWIPLIGWFFTSRAVNKSIIWPILILISTCLSLYEFYKGLSDAYNIFNSAASGVTLATDIANQPVDYLGWIFYLLALIAEFIILKGLAKTLNFSLTRTVVIFLFSGPFWFMRNRLKNQPSTQKETEKIEYL